MSIQFVEMYHPLLPDTVLTPARVALSSVDDWMPRGWLLVDPDVAPPAPATPYYTRAELLSQIQGGAAPVGTALRAAFGSVLADNPAVVAAAEDAVSAAGPNLVRVVKGTGTGYPARPVGAALVEYIGPLKPTDWLDDDCWTPTNGVPSGQEII